jgi:hypothetical protein
MNTAQQLGSGTLTEAIANVKHLRNKLQVNEDNFEEAELLYQMTSLLMELDKYFSGGYLSDYYVEEKCQTITACVKSIHKGRFEQ